MYKLRLKKMSSIRPYVITHRCKEVMDASCLKVCPVDCIYTHPEAQQYYIHPQECIDCGSCEMVCPVQAIYRIDEVPQSEEAAIEENASFFTTYPNYLDYHKQSWQ